MNWFLRFAVWVSGYRTVTITVSKGFGFGEVMTVIGKRNRSASTTTLLKGEKDG